MPRVDIRSIRRRQILEAAKRLAAQKGWTETTIADICQAANVSTGVVTRHFESKGEIMLAALEDVLEQFRAQLELSLGNEKSLSETTHSYFQELSQFMISQPILPWLLVHFVAASISRLEVAERLRAVFYHLCQQDITNFERMQDEQGIKGNDPVLVAKLLHTLALSLILSPVFLEIDFPPEQLALHFSNMLLKYFDLPEVAKE
jgi:AcrR family transcriptional regulator